MRGKFIRRLSREARIDDERGGGEWRERHPVTDVFIVAAASDNSNASL